MFPISDEQKGGETRQLPEDQQQQQILGQHDAQHRAHEQQQECIKTAGGILGLQVVARIQNNQKPDAHDQVREQHSEPVEAKSELQSDRREPRPGDDQRLSPERRRRKDHQAHEGQSGDQRRRYRRIEPQARFEYDRKQCTKKRYGHQAC